MQISVLKKLLQLIKSSESPEEVKSSEATSEQEAVENEIQNEELKLDDQDIEAISEEPVEETKVVHTENNRSHLTSSVPRAAKVPLGALSKGELAEIRALFSNMDDGEIARLYKKVTK